MYAQNPNHFVIGSDELIGVNIYSLLYDEETDILYAGTNNGLYAYKQSKFHQLSGPKSQNGDSFFHLTKKGGDIFCCNLTGQIFEIENNKYTLYYEFPSEDIGSYFNFEFDDNHNLYGVSKSIMKYSKKNDTLTFLDIAFERSRINFLNVSIIDDVLYGASSSELIEVSLNGEYKPIYYYSQAMGAGIVQGVRGTYKINDKIVALLNNGEYVYVSNEKELINLSSNRMLERAFPVNENSLIAMGRNNGVRLIHFNNDTLSSSLDYFKNELISSHYVTSDGTFFLGTFGKGVKVIPQFDVSKEEFDSELSGIELATEDTVYLSSYSGEVFRSIKGQTELIAQYDENIDNVFRIPFDIPLMADKKLIHSHIGIFSGIKDIDFIDSSKILICNQNGIYLLTNEEVNINFQNYKCIDGIHIYCLHGLNERVFSVKWDAINSCIYYSTNFGVFKKELRSDKVIELKINNESISSYVLDFDQGKLFIGTKNMAVIVFQDDKELYRIDESNGLLSTSIKKIEVDGDYIYILSLKGVQIFDLKTKELIHLGVAEGLVDNSKVERFRVFNDKLWILEKGGFYALNIDNKHKNYSVGEIFIDSITVNGSSIDWNSTSSFSHDKNEFYFHFDYRDILSKKETQILYTLEGFYDEWKTLDAESYEINFQSLPVGDYTFRIKAIYRMQESREFSYSFQISSPIWQRWWFTTIIVLVVIGIVALYYRGRLKQQNEKLQLVNDFNNAKLTAIQSQMNPHFIFNSLNSIQALVLRGDIDNSYAYINKFSSLVRKTLNYSNLDFIELEKEVELLKIYLELEKLRFRDEFEYEVICETDEDISLPPMLIQPFIENAIVHGLMHREGLKRISVNIVVNDVVTCVIEDNGVGRVVSKEINDRQRPDHESFAIEGIKTRLLILSKTFDSSIGFDYEDLYEGEKASGTRLTIKIPYKNNFS